MSVFFHDCYPCSTIQVFEHLVVAFLTKGCKIQTVLLEDEQNFKRGMSKRGHKYKERIVPLWPLCLMGPKFFLSLIGSWFICLCWKCYLWYCRSLCIMNGYFYFKKNCFLHMAFKCLSLWSEGIKSIGVESKSGISLCGYVGSQMDKRSAYGFQCHLPWYL